MNTKFNAKRLLFVCARNRLRSPTAEQIFAIDGFDTESAGVAPDADTPLDDETILWADIIFFMEAAHLKKAKRRFGESLRAMRVICLRILDRYAHMDPALITILRARVRRYV